MAENKKLTEKEKADKIKAKAKADKIKEKAKADKMKAKSGGMGFSLFRSINPYAPRPLEPKKIYTTPLSMDDRLAMATFIVAKMGSFRLSYWQWNRGVDKLKEKQEAELTENDKQFIDTVNTAFKNDNDMYSKFFDGTKLLGTLIDKHTTISETDLQELYDKTLGDIEIDNLNKYAYSIKNA